MGKELMHHGEGFKVQGRTEEGNSGLGRIIFFGYEIQRNIFRHIF